MTTGAPGQPSLRLVPRADTTTPSASPRWREDAACIGLDTELFFPVGYDVESTETPRRVCRGCPVRAECLADVLAVEDPARRFGISGGTTPSERRVLHRAGLTFSTPAIGGDVA